MGGGPEHGNDSADRGQEMMRQLQELSNSLKNSPDRATKFKGEVAGKGVANRAEEYNAAQLAKLEQAVTGGQKPAEQEKPYDPNYDARNNGSMDYSRTGIPNRPKSTTPAEGARNQEVAREAGRGKVSDALGKLEGLAKSAGASNDLNYQAKIKAEMQQQIHIIKSAPVGPNDQFHIGPNAAKVLHLPNKGVITGTELKRA